MSMAIGFCAPSITFALDEAPEAELPPDQQELPRIEVTGYHIKRIDTEGPAPVVVYDRKALDASGVNTLEDFARYLTINHQVMNDMQSQYTLIPGAAGFNLRGIGMDATLTLLNGMRVAPYGESNDGRQAFVDINAIPMAAVDRIEVLKDGASAIYGSDAIAGVVNIVLRDTYQGTQVTAGYQQTRHGDGAELVADVLTGFEGERGNLLFSLYYLNRNPIESKDRPVTADSDYSAIGGPNQRSPFGSPPSLFRYDTFSFEPDPECGTDPLLSSSIPAFRGSWCSFNFRQFDRIVIDSERLSASLLAGYDMTPRTRAFTEVFYNRNDSFNQLAATPIIGSPILPTVLGFPFVSADHPDNPFGVDGELFVRPLDPGPRESEIESTAYRLVAGLEGYLDRWDWRINAMYSANEVQRQRLHGLLRSRFQLALLGEGGPNGDQYYNPFGFDPQNDPAIIDWFTVDTRRTSDRTENSLDVTLGTSFGSLPGGSVGLAMGLQYRQQDLEEWADENELSPDLFGGTEVVISGDRDIASAYFEFSLPLLESLEAQLAARWEHYSDFGSSTNPKLALRWQPGPSWMIRGSWSTSFKPPSFQELYGPPIVQLWGFIDWPRCDVTGAQQDCDFWFYDTEIGGNPDLHPEEGESWYLGGMWAPEFAPGLELALDFWQFRHDERIIRFSPQLILDARSDLGIIRGEPTPEDIALGAPARITRVIQTFRNSDELETSGFDTTIRYRWTAERLGDFTLGLEHTYIDKYEFTDSNAFSVEEGFNFAGRFFDRAMPRNRANLYLTWGQGANGASAGLHYAGHYENFVNQYVDGELTDQPWIIRSHTTLDLQYTRVIEQLWNARLRVGCQNCTDRDPPFTTDVNGELMHDARGAIWYLRWEQPLNR